MDLNLLNEAFRQFEILEEEDFNLNDEDDMKEMDKLISDTDDVQEIEVIDPDAEDEDDIEDSYEGKVILQCNVCKSLIYEDKEDIELNDEMTEANMEDECPYCFSDDGYKVIGQVCPLQVDGEEESDDEPDDDEPDDEPEDNETEETGEQDEDADDDLEESLNEAPQLSKIVLNKLDESERTEEGLLDTTTDIVQDAIVGGPLGAVTKAVEKIGDSQESLDEDFKNVNIETEDQRLSMETDDNGKITIESEPLTNEPPDLEADATFNSMPATDGEMIAPVDDETKADIENDGEENMMDEVNFDDLEEIDAESEQEDEAGEDEDIPVDDFENESFDYLGTSYLKNIYENVSSYKTIDVSETKNGLMVEGLISFNSGKVKPTKFIFEAKTVDKNGTVKLTGMNETFSRGKKSFALYGKVQDKKLISESLNYNYRAKDVTGKSQRVYGTVKK